MPSATPMWKRIPPKLGSSNHSSRDEQITKGLEEVGRISNGIGIADAICINTRTYIGLLADDGQTRGNLS